MPLIQNHFTSLLVPVLYHHFEIGLQTVPMMRDVMFTVQNSTTSVEYGTTLGGMSVDAWDVYNTGTRKQGRKGELDFDQLYTQTYTHQEYPVKFHIEKRLMLNDQYGIIGKQARRVGISAAQKMEKDAATLLNNAFATTTWSDSTYLCSDSHPRSPQDTGTTYFDNKGTSALTAQAVSDTRIAMMKFQDDRLNTIGVVPDELWVPVDLSDTAWTITNSAQQPDTANNNANPQNMQGRWNVYVWQSLTDTNNWFMCSSVLRRECVNWYFREPFQIMQTDESTTHVTFEAKLHYSYGVDDWRWIYGHLVT